MARPKTTQPKNSTLDTTIEEIEDVSSSKNPIGRSMLEKDGEFSLGMILCDQILFSLFYQQRDLSLGLSFEQKLMFADESKRVLLCTSRSVAKTVGIVGRISRDAVTYLPDPRSRDDEILTVTPTSGHMSQLADRVFSKLKENILFSSLIKTWHRSSESQKIATNNGLTIHFRIEGSIDDRNMTGPHPHKIYCDEMAFGNFACHRSRAGGAKPTCQWLYAGVPNGVRDTPFYQLDQTHDGDSWSRHRASMITANPLYTSSPGYAKEMEDLFGGVFSQDYHTQVQGEWGSEAISSFNAGTISFNKTVGQPNGYKYYIARAASGDVEKAINTSKLYELLRIPSVNPLRAVIGWDYGESPDPTTFLLAVQYADKTPWQTYARISLYGVPSPRQLEVLQHLWENTLNRKCVMLSMDNKVQYHYMMEDKYKALFEGKIKMTQFNSTVEIDMVTGKMVTETNKDDQIVLEHRKDGKIIKDWRKYLLTEQLKRYMLSHIYGDTEHTRLELGYDPDMENELLGTVERRTMSHVVYDTPKVKSNKNSPKPDQIVDALRALTDAILVVDSEKPDEVPQDISAMLASFGWTGSNTSLSKGWRQPWQNR